MGLGLCFGFIGGVWDRYCAGWNSPTVLNSVDASTQTMQLESFEFPDCCCSLSLLVRLV